MARDLPGAVTEAVRQVRDRYDRFNDRLNNRQQRLLHVLTFLTRFTVLAAPLWLVLLAGWESAAARRETAAAAAAVLRFIGIDAAATGSLVRTGELVVNVTWDSTGWKSVAAFVALVAASYRPLRSKAAAAIAGSAALIAVNVARIVSMVYAVTVLGASYELLHTVLWRWGLTTAVLLLWTGWLWATAGSQRLQWRPLRHLS